MSECEVILSPVDIPFLRALLSLHSTLDDACILRNSGEILVCRKSVAHYSDIAEIPHGDFATGWQNYSGEDGCWTTWESIEKFVNAENEELKIQPAPILNLNSTRTNSEIWQSSIDRNTFEDTVKKIKSDMTHGEYFLINLTRILESNFEFDPKYVAIKSCLFHDTPFRFYMQLNGRTILGLSPERFAKIDNGIITCEPMKGTAQNAANLQESLKEHIENTMMIDLVRSDLSKVCHPDSISLVERNRITSHPGLYQMSSTIEGKVSAKYSNAQAIKQMLPVASVTGTPKPFVLKKIDEYEPASRDTYCGIYGWIDNNQNNCDFAVGIRTIAMKEGSAKIGVGSGITIDSDPVKEFEETELKASRLTALVEDSRLHRNNGVFTSLRITEDKQCFQLDDHILRVQRHAQAVGVEVSLQEIKTNVKSFLLDTNIRNDSYLKISISEIGKIECTIENFEIEKKPLSIGIAPVPAEVAAESPKFVNRSRYTCALETAKMLARTDIDDSILLANGYLTETTRANLFLKIADEIFTPKFEFGMIKGIAHQTVMEHLEREGIKVNVRKISLEDLIQATEVITTNSVRGVQKAGSITSLILQQDIDLTGGSDDLFEIATKALRV